MALISVYVQVGSYLVASTFAPMTQQTELKIQASLRHFTCSFISTSEIIAIVNKGPCEAVTLSCRCLVLASFSFES